MSPHGRLSVAIVACALATACTLTPASRTGRPGTRKSAGPGGSLEKAQIQKVIRSHRDQIRSCFETQLARFPDLDGKVTVKFVISALGTVSDSEVAESSVGNPELEQCVAGSVRTWTFPKPKGGGVVVVTYPFTFKQAPAATPPAPPGLEKDESDPEVALEEGAALFKKRRYREAEALFVKCLELDPSFAECHLALGSIYARLRKPEKGAGHYREFLRLAPDHRRAPEVRTLLKEYEDLNKQRETPERAPETIEI